MFFSYPMSSFIDIEIGFSLIRTLPENILRKLNFLCLYDVMEGFFSCSMEAYVTT